MRKTNFLSALMVLAIAVTAFTITSCEDEIIRGCTDPESTNYDALAAEDDGTCTYDRDRFYGIYLGPFGCPTFPLLNNDSIFVEITEGMFSTTDSVIINFSTVPPISVNAAVDGDLLTVMGTVDEVDVMGQILDIEASGEVELKDSDSLLEGMINLVGKTSATGATVISTDCDYSGTRQ